MMESLSGENKDSIQVSIKMNNLGIVKQYRGLFQEAKQLFRDSLEMKKRIFGANRYHMEVGNTMYWIGENYGLLGCYDD